MSHVAIALALLGLSSPAVAQSRGMVEIPRGAYSPLYAAAGQRTQVAAFRLDRYQVTRAQYLDFVSSHPLWRRSAIHSADYLAGWRGDLDAGSARDLPRPVTQVTRSAAIAYCTARGARLPSLDEWEYAAGASATLRNGEADPAFRQQLMELYTRPRARGPMTVKEGYRNAFGVVGMHGNVWEWVAPEGHSHHGPGEHDLSCAGSARGASDPSDFPAFLRYAFRSGLEAQDTHANLGFRCAV